MFDWLAEMLKQAGIGMLWPIQEFVNDGNSRYFWLYCVTGILIAHIVTEQGKKRNPGELPLFAAEA
jgi:hypothetical protein